MCSRRSRDLAREGFTLVEVIVAIGITAVSVTAAVALLAALGRSPGALHARNQAVQLADAISAELARLREASTDADKLGALAAQIPSATDTRALRLVGSLDGLRVGQESGPSDAANAIPPADQFFLIEIRQQAGELGYAPGAGCLAVTATIRWPYRLRSGPSATDSVPAGLSQASSVVLNLAVTL